MYIYIYYIYIYYIYILYICITHFQIDLQNHIKLVGDLIISHELYTITSHYGWFITKLDHISCSAKTRLVGSQLSC